MTVSAIGMWGTGESTIWVHWNDNNKKVREVYALDEVEKIKAFSGLQ